MAAVYIDEKTVRKALAVAAKGVEKENWINDAAQTGLAIRIQGQGASWVFRAKDIGKIALAQVAPGWHTADDISILRRIVKQGRTFGSGPDAKAKLKVWLRRAVELRDPDKAAGRVAVEQGSAWSFADARQRYLQSVLDSIAFDTHRSYRSVLAAVEGSKLAHHYAHIVDLPLSEITELDIVRVRNSIAGDGHWRQAELALAAMKSMFAWALGREGAVGLKTNPARDVTMKGAVRVNRAPTDGLDKDEKVSIAPRALSLAELGRLMQALDGYPKRAPTLALQLQLLTGQRRRTVAAAKVVGMKRDTGMVWEIDPDAEKSHKTRPLPLPSLASSVVERALAMLPSGSEWLFPQMRPSKAGGTADGHMNVRTISDVLLDLRQPGKPMASVPWLSTHDLRRAFVTHMEPRLRLLELDRETSIALITRSDEGREGLDAAVYNLGVRMRDKRRILELWDEIMAAAVRDPNGIQNDWMPERFGGRLEI